VSEIVRIAQSILKVLDHQIEYADALREQNPRARALPERDRQNITRAAIVTRLWRRAVLEV
jgi:hypothetical protein